MCSTADVENPRLRLGCVINLAQEEQEFPTNGQGRWYGLFVIRSANSHFQLCLMDYLRSALEVNSTKWQPRVVTERVGTASHSSSSSRGTFALE